MIRIRFSRGLGWKAALIRQATSSAFSEVGFKMPDHAVFDVTPRYGAIPRYVLDDDSTRYLVPEIPDETVAQAVRWAAGFAGRPFDWGALHGIGRNWRDDRAWFPSELVAAAFDAVGAPLLPNFDHKKRVTPRDLLLSDKLVKISKT